ncbi:MAG TPA: pilus assembly protein PilM, partial [Firmicutes bacterium]|nr:pilus assembly protein PilM [Bacillota bacterium]
MSVEKKFDLKALASMDVKDLFKKRNVSGEDREKTSKAMMKPVVSFDFGSSFIKIVEGRYVRGQLKVSKWFKVETPVGAIVDGKIMDKISLVNALEQGLKLYKLKATDAICVINSTQIINRELLIPVVADDEVETVVRYEIQKFLPINLDDYLVQYVKLGEVEVNGAMKYRLNIITFPQKMGYAYYELMKELDLKPYVLDVSYNAIGKLCNYTKMLNTVTDAEGTVAFVDMGA